MQSFIKRADSMTAVYPGGFQDGVNMLVTLDGVAYKIDPVIEGSQAIVSPDMLHQGELFEDGVYNMVWFLENNPSVGKSHMFIYTHQAAMIMALRCKCDYTDAWAYREALKFIESYQYGKVADAQCIFEKMVELINTGPVVLADSCGCTCGC